MRRPALLAAALAAALSLSADEGSPLLQDAVSAYRAGRSFEALEKLGALVEREPDNALARNYIWTITRKIQKEDKDLAVSAGEREAASALAEAELSGRRRRTQEVLEEMRAAERRSADFRSPADILDGMRGAHQFLGGDLEGDLAQAQAKSYVGQIVANLTHALEKNLFVSRKDNLRAEGYRAYLNGDAAQAVKSWEAALKEDPADAALAKELEDLRELVSRKEREEKIVDLIYQAKAHFRGGDYAEALAAWRDVLALEPHRPGAAEQAAAVGAALDKSSQKRRLKEGVDRGVTLYKAGDSLGAAQAWLDVLREDPAQEDARSWLEHASRRLKAAPLERPADVPSSAPSTDRQARALERYKRGIMNYARGSLAEAVHEWEEALKEDPQLARAREALRQAQMEINLR